MDVVVVGILYPAVKKYLKDYMCSINSQTYQDFSLLLFNNQFGPTNDIVKQLNCATTIVPVPLNSSIIMVRQKMLSTLLQRAPDIVIFTDTDDFFDKNRFAQTLKILDTAPIAFTNLAKVNEQGQSMGSLFLPETLNTVGFEDIIEKNVLGFSHTAMRGSLLKKVWPYPANVRVGDWWFFASLLAQGYVATMIPSTLTYYRQYEQNIAGMRCEVTPEQVLFATQVKNAQYQALLPHLNGKMFQTVEIALNNSLELATHFHNPVTLFQYTQTINEQKKPWLWWEFVNKHLM